MPDKDSPGPRSRHSSRASFACDRCKKDKRRCDISQVQSRGSRQSCTACRHRNEECRVQYGEDKRSRRKQMSNKELQSRIAVLERLVEESSNGNAGSIREDDEPLPMADAESHQGGQFPSPVTSESPFSQATGASNPKIAAKTHRPRIHCQNALENFPTVLNEVTAPTGGLLGRDSGTDQYFGSTSLFPYSERQSSLQIHGGDADATSGEEEINQRARVAAEASPEPEPIVSHLLDLFWTWQHSHLLVVDQAIFLRHRRMWEEDAARADRNFYTPCLLYSILALASMISLDKGVQRYSAPPGGISGERFCQKARQLFELELERPTITTVQTALILGSRYGAMVDNSLGWTFSGLAFRLAVKIGLHLDCSRALSSDQMTVEMADNRRVAFWGCYIEDKSWSAYCSRPMVFMDWDITVGVPQKPSQDNTSTPSAGFQPPLLARKIVALSIICSRALLGLYARRRESSEDDLRKVVSQVHTELWQWHQTLPSDLLWARGNDNAPISPHVLTLHMKFYFTLILVHRPFLQFSKVIQSLSQQSGAPLSSTKTCMIAATNIAKLAHDYRQYYSIRQVPVQTVHWTFIAATIHSVNFTLTKDESHSLLLDECVSALTEMGHSYPVAHKAVSVLQGIIEKWIPAHESEDDANATIPSQGRHGMSCSPAEAAIEVPQLLDMEGLFDSQVKHSENSVNNTTTFPSGVSSSIFDEIMTGDIGDLPAAAIGGDGTGSLNEDTALFDAIYGSTFALTWDDSLLGDLSQSAPATRSA